MSNGLDLELRSGPKKIGRTVLAIIVVILIVAIVILSAALTAPSGAKEPIATPPRR